MARRTRITGAAALLAAVVMASPGWGQTTADMNVQPSVPAGGGGVVQMKDPNDPMLQAYARQQKQRVNLERELRKIRFTYFRSAKNRELRQAGIARLREFNDPAVFPSLLEVFRDEGMDVRTAIVEQLASYGTDEADATLAWTSVFDHEKKMRELALRYLQDRCAQAGTVSRRVQSVVAEGLRRTNETQLASAAVVADVLNLYEAIPMLVAAQAGGTGGGGGDSGSGGDGALAYILIGRQEAFVSDLTPVVGDSAVAFDPTLGVVTEGVYLRVIDAYVITYRADVHNALVRLSSRGFGRDTSRLGWDGDAWRRWYYTEFVPYRAAIEAQKADAAAPPGGG